MVVDRGWASRVSAWLGAMRTTGATAETEAWRALQGDQYAPPPPLDTAPSAVLIRRINRIALAHGWQSAITETLDKHGVGYLSDLSESQLQALATQMDAYEDNAACGHSP